MLANQILMPFAPKYSVMQRAMQASHWEKEVVEKKASRKDKKEQLQSRALENAEEKLKNIENSLGESP